MISHWKELFAEQVEALQFRYVAFNGGPDGFAPQQKPHFGGGDLVNRLKRWVHGVCVYICIYI